MNTGLKLAAMLIALVPTGAYAAMNGISLQLGTDGMLDNNRTISATPFDPNSISQDRFFGGTGYSTRQVAVELILNAAQLRNNDSLVYRRQHHSGYRITTRWRLRASTRRVLIRYEIRF